MNSLFLMIMRINRMVLFLFFTAGINFLQAQTLIPACEKCKEKPVETIEKNLEAVTTQMVAEFLCTFHESCALDLHYTEYANRMLYWMLKRFPSFVITELETNSSFSNEYILDQIRTPLNLDQDLKFIYTEVNKVKTKADVKRQILSALKAAAEKTGVEIE